jgi:hypothetical protein
LYLFIIIFRADLHELKHTNGIYGELTEGGDEGEEEY